MSLALISGALSVLGVLIAAVNTFTMPQKYDAAEGEWVAAITPARRLAHMGAAVLIGVGVVLAFFLYAQEHFA